MFLLALMLGSLIWFPHQASTPDAENRLAASATPGTGAGRITEPKKIKSVPPKWPDNARRAGLTGLVALECVIDKEGRVQDTKVLDGHRSLAEAAQVAVRKWRYTPTKLDGEAVPVVMTVTVNFKLEEPQSGTVFLKPFTIQIQRFGGRRCGGWVDIARSQASRKTQSEMLLPTPVSSFGPLPRRQWRSSRRSEK